MMMIDRRSDSAYAWVGVGGRGWAWGYPAICAHQALISKVAVLKAVVALKVGDRRLAVAARHRFDILKAGGTEGYFQHLLNAGSMLSYHNVTNSDRPSAQILRPLVRAMHRTCGATESVRCRGGPAVPSSSQQFPAVRSIPHTRASTIRGRSAASGQVPRYTGH